LGLLGLGVNWDIVVTLYLNNRIRYINLITLVIQDTLHKEFKKYIYYLVRKKVRLISGPK